MTSKTKTVLITTTAITFVLISSLSFYDANHLFAKELESNDQSLALVNAERKSKSLDQLTYNLTLEKAAQDKVNDIFEKNYFDHTAPDGTKAWNFILAEGYDYKVAGENLAIDFDNIDDAFIAWKNSPTHYKNIISKDYTDYAIAEKEGVLNGLETKVFVQLFAAK